MRCHIIVVRFYWRKKKSILIYGNAFKHFQAFKFNARYYVHLNSPTGVAFATNPFVVVAGAINEWP